MNKPPPLTVDEYDDLLRLFDRLGEVGLVAKELEVEESVIHHYMELYPELAGMIGLVKPPSTEAELMDRPGPGPLVPVPNGTAAKRMKEEEALLQPSLEALGMEPEMARRMVLLRNYGRDQFSSLRQMVGGGMVMNYSRLHDAIQKMYLRLEEPGLRSVDRMQLVNELDILLGHYHQVCDRAQHAALMEMKLAASQSDRKSRSKKPGFRPVVAIKADNVHITKPDGELSPPAED